MSNFRCFCSEVCYLNAYENSRGNKKECFENKQAMQFQLCGGVILLVTVLVVVTALHSRLSNCLPWGACLGRCDARISLDLYAVVTSALQTALQALSSSRSADQCCNLLVSVNSRPEKHLDWGKMCQTEFSGILKLKTKKFSFIKHLILYPQAQPLLKGN